ncbi:hypothetical protein SEPCBS119000_003242 [Sporothrix epigloea]|uniref:Transcription factor Iwr1 domain-containing protein n=1 Tax=Sporothrix epigloea TaxID=1892477 RepID=A0ABP0DKM0_9PEZI
MSLPPQVIQVKRKRTEDGPMPSYLRIENTTKRHRSDAFLYRRHDPQAAAAALAAKRAEEAAAEAFGGRAARPPTIQSSKRGDEKRNKAGGSSQPSTPIKAATATATTTDSTLPAKTAASSTSLPAEPRRFHLSRDSLLAAHASAASVLGVSGSAGVRKRSRYSHGGDGRPEAAAVFVEKSLRRQKKRYRTRQSPSEAVPAVSEIVAPLPKRPSRRALVTVEAPSADGTVTGRSSEPPSKAATPALPPSLRNRQWDTDIDQLTREMNDYTLEMIGRSLAQMQTQKQGPGQNLSSQQAQEAAPSEHEMSRLAKERRKAAYAKYKPKPGPRYAERHADCMTDGPVEGEAGSHDDKDNVHDADSSDDDSMPTDDEDYVTETYVRIPGHEAAKEQAQAQAQAQAGGHAVPGNIGLLVFDNEPDLDFFYGVEEDSDEDGEDDEDENAENYYTHDYPEDEVSSDDEYGRDAYLYQTLNATDLDFESDDEGGTAADGHGDRAANGVTELFGNIKLTRPGDL